MKVLASRAITFIQDLEPPLSAPVLILGHPLSALTQISDLDVAFRFFDRFHVVDNFFVALIIFPGKIM